MKLWFIVLVLFGLMLYMCMCGFVSCSVVVMLVVSLLLLIGMIIVLRLGVCVVYL